MRLTVNQLERASEIFGNLAVAWFSAGVIAPVFARPQVWLNFGLTFGVSLVMAGLSFMVSLELARGVD